MYNAAGRGQHLSAVYKSRNIRDVCMQIVLYTLFRYDMSIAMICCSHPPSECTRFM